MASTISEYLAKSAYIKTDSAATKKKFYLIGTQFSTLIGLKKATIEELNSLKTLDHAPLIRPLTQKEQEVFNLIKKEINPRVSIEENFVFLLTKRFIKKQLVMLEELTLDSISANPLLCNALKMSSVTDLVKYIVYSSATRSIVTSMGYLIEDLLLFSNPDVQNGKDFAEGLSNKWDLVIERLDSVRCYIEVKSGPNDMDKTQMKSYNREIKEVENLGYKGYVGFSYGRKDMKTVTTGLLPQYLDDWESHTLMGTELWDFVSGDPTYHERLMSVIKYTAETILRGKSIIRMIDKKVKEITKEFNERYHSVDDYFAQLW